MIVYDLEGNEYRLNLSQNSVTKAKYRETRSNLHVEARNILEEVFPAQKILEEVPIQITPKQTLYLDFFLPLKSLVVEVNGQQHYKYIHHFHGNKTNFFKQKKNDSDKKEWCKINYFNLLTLRWDNVKEWKDIIHGFFG